MAIKEEVSHQIKETQNSQTSKESLQKMKVIGHSSLKQPSHGKNMLPGSPLFMEKSLLNVAICVKKII